MEYLLERKASTPKFNSELLVFFTSVSWFYLWFLQHFLVWKSAPESRNNCLCFEIICLMYCTRNVLATACVSEIFPNWNNTWPMTHLFLVTFYFTVVAFNKLFLIILNFLPVCWSIRLLPIGFIILWCNVWWFVMTRSSQCCYCYSVTVIVFFIPYSEIAL